MAHQRPDLIVPIRDRRQRKRYLTLKNFGWFMLAAVVLFIGISIRSEMRGPSGNDFGRLFSRTIASDVEQKKPVEVVHEAPPAISDDTHADPMLVAPAARAQWLEGEDPATTTTPMTSIIPVTTASTVSPATGDVVIVGGPEGVAIVKKDRRKPVLSGGFGR